MTVNDTESTAAVGLGQPGAARFSLNWIVGPRIDLCCFIGAALLGYGMFFLHAGLAMNMVTVWFIWYMFLDSPHFFGTYSRTYLDREEMRDRRALLLGSIGLLGVGPLFVLGCWMLYSADVGWYKAPFLVLVTFVSTWAYWHVVRQHFGIMSLYKRKNQDAAVLDRSIDRWVLYIALMAPFVGFVVTNQFARESLGAVAGTDLGAYVGTPGAWDTLIRHATVLIAAGAIAVFLIRQIQRAVGGQTINAAKVLFMLAVIPLHLVICYHPKSTTLALLGFGACVTIFHDMQYHAIIWYYQKNRMVKAGEAAREKYGIAAKLGSSLPLYIICAVGMGVTLGLLGCLTNVNPGCIPVLETREIALFGEMSLEELFYGIFLGVLMHHYFVDQFIWRPSKDQNLKKDLKISDGGGQPA